MSDSGPGPGTGLVGPSIYLADLGGTNKVWFTDANAPYPIPSPKNTYGTELYEMRYGGPGLPGYRVAQLTGTSRSFDDYEFDVGTVSAAMKTALDLKRYSTTPSLMEMSPDGGTTRYIVAWAKDGYFPEKWTENYRKEGVKLKVHVLSQI